MADPAVALQRAVHAALKAAAGVTDRIGGADKPRIYDRVPDGARADFPYLTIGDDDVIDDTHCDAAFECFVKVHIWTRAVGRIEAKELFAPIRDAIDTDDFTVAGFVVTEHEFRTSRAFPDADGLTTHGIIEFRLLLDLA